MANICLPDVLNYPRYLREGSGRARRFSVGVKATKTHTIEVWSLSSKIGIYKHFELCIFKRLVNNTCLQVYNIHMITHRCIQNRLCVSNDTMKLVKHIGHGSKNLYNTGVFAYKKFMELHDIQLDYYCAHLDEYLSSFSPNDRLLVGRKLCFRGELEKMKRLVRSSHIGETDLKSMLNDPHTFQENPNLEGSRLMSFEDTYKFINNREAELIVLAKTNTHLIEFIKDIKPVILHKSENLKDTIPISIDVCHTKRNIVMMKTPDSTILENYVANKCSSYRQMAAQSAQQTINRVMMSFASYFALKASENMVGKRVSLPKYLEKNEYYSRGIMKNFFGHIWCPKLEILPTPSRHIFRPLLEFLFLPTPARHFRI